MTDVGRYGLGDLGDIEPKAFETYMDIYRAFQPSIVGATAGTGSLTDGNALQVWPFFIPMTKRFNAHIWLQTALGPSTFVRFGVYNNKFGALYPGRLLWAGTEWDLAMLGVYFKEESITPVLLLNGPALYWMAMFKGGNNAGIGMHPGLPSNFPTYVAYMTYGALPDPFPSGANTPFSYGFMSWLRQYAV